jgi:hypothetical protein
MHTKYPLGEVVLKNNRIYLVHSAKGYWQEVDVTPLWHFFKEVTEFSKNLVPPNDKCTCVTEKLQGCTNCPRQQVD